MLTQKVILGYSTRIAIQVITMIAGIVVARLAGPSIIGTVSFGLSFVSMFIFFTDLGIGGAHIKLVSEGRDKADCIKTFAVLKTCLIGLYIVLMAGTLMIHRYVLNLRFETNAHYVVILISFLAVVLGQFITVPVTTFMALTEQARQDIPSLIQTVLVQGFRVIAVILFGTAISLSLAFLAGTMLILPLYWYLYSDYPMGKFNRPLAHDYFNIAKPMLFILLYSMLVNYLDKVLLQYFCNSEQVGYYSVGYSFAGVIQTIGATVGLLFFPTFSAAVSRNDYTYINSVIDRFERFVLLFLMPAVLLLMLYSNVVVKLVVGGKFMPSGNVLFYILAGAFIVVMSQHYGNLLVGANFIKAAGIINLLGIVFFFLADVALVMPRLGNMKALGTAIAMALDYGFISILYRVWVRKKIASIPAWRNKKLWLYGFGVFLLSLCASYMMKLDSMRAYQQLLFGVVCFSTIYAGMYAFGLIRRSDLDMFKKVIEVKPVIEYVSG